jgi:hypothetical protein
MPVRLQCAIMSESLAHHDSSHKQMIDCRTDSRICTSQQAWPGKSTCLGPATMMLRMEKRRICTLDVDQSMTSCHFKHNKQPHE